MKKFKSRKFFVLVFCTILIVVCGLFSFYKGKSITEIENYNILSYNSTEKSDSDIIYLSDIPYLKAQIGYGTIGLDKTSSNASLTMKLDGATTVIKKGIWAHATSTVEYDISNYKNYDYFTTYYGLNTTAGSNGNGVKFYIYTSKDGKNWTLQTEENPTSLKGTNNAVHVKIDVREANYIRLYANDNGSNGNDHAVWGDAKLVKEGYSDNVMMTKEEFDKIIKEHYKSGPIPDDLKLVLLQRNFIKNVGQYQLRSFLESDSKNYETIDWFLNNEEALRLWTIGGKPSGTYEKALQVLSNLYHTYKADLSNEDVTALGTKYKDLYLRMMLSLSLTHSGTVGLWTDIRQTSNAINRYAIYKQMHLNGQLASNSMFESYTIDEMRGVMANNIDDEEILWLHDYSKKFSTDAERFNPYKYIKYTLNYGYYRPKYYSKENYAMWDAKYNLSKYNVPYQASRPKLWIVFEEGSVCGGLSKTACNLYGVWGYPARVVGQPGHAAYVYMYNAGGGNYAWQLANSATPTGWANTTGGGFNGWGSKYATNNGTIKTGSYLLLAQEAQNEYEKYEQAELILLLEDVYKNDRKQLEQIYRDALKEEIINLDAWIGLVNLYISDETKEEKDLIELAEEIAEVYTYHPLPMYDLTRRIGSKITSAGYKSRLMMLQDETLRKATKATIKNTIYHKEIPVIANALLGVVDSKVATFSFDGTNAGKIVLSKQLQSTQVTWEYSIDGGNTWNTSYEHSEQLTQEQIDCITFDNDIKIHIIGVPRTEENIYTIDIQKGVFPSNTVSIDDLENRMFGTTDKMEWTSDPDGEWYSFADTNPIFSGDKVIYVRMRATGTKTTTNTVRYTFTMNASSATNRYIPRSNLEVVSVSSTSKGNKDNILDGNMNTSWRSKPGAMFSGTYPTSNVILKIVDKPRYVSELDYIPEQNAKTSAGNYISGRAKKINVYVSMDGQTWELAATQNNLGNNNNQKKITFPEAKEAQYIKIECTEVYDMQPYENFFSISVINLYENPSASLVPTAEVNYSVIKKTNKDVVAELIDENRPITVINNGGKKTYTFTKNGEFTFEFVDNNGNKGSATAIVDWIDKEAPTVEVKFNTTEITNEDVVATLSFDKKVNILSEDVQVSENPVDKSQTITFLENESFELKFEDELGNIGTKTIAVDWIDKEAPTAEFEFNTTHLTDGAVIATLKPSEDVTVTNNGGKDTYTFNDNGSFTFEFVDKAGNTGTATANVNWIARLPKYEIKYSTTELTNKEVKVILELEEGYRIFNNNANKEYTFTESGTFNFQYKDENGYDGVIPVTVDWIDKEAPTAEFEYSTNNWTNKNVIATLKPSEEVTITNNDGKDTYTFTKNGEFTFEFIDKVGNKGKATAKVDWIDKVAPTATIEYSTKEVTEGPVIATLKANEEITILGNGKSTYTFNENAEYTFEFVDRAGNKGYATAKVNWIQKNKNDKPEEKPSTNTKPNNKNEGTVSSTTKPTTNQNRKPNTSENISNTNKSENKYQNMTTENITVKIPDSILSNYNGTSLDYQKHPLNDAQKDQYGKDSEIYEIKLKDKNNNKEIDLSKETIEQTIKLNPNKKFDAIYVIREDGSIVKLASKINENNELVFEDNGLGKYLVSYKSDVYDLEAEEDIEDSNIQKKEENEIEIKKANYLPYILGSLIILILCIIIYNIVQKNRNYKAD